MAKPTIPCKLKKGKAIGANSNFADTYNYAVDFIYNLRGDAQEDYSNCITLDRTIDTHPVIRFKNPMTTDTSLSSKLNPIQKSLEQKYIDTAKERKNYLQLYNFDNAQVGTVPMSFGGVLCSNPPDEELENFYKGQRVYAYLMQAEDYEKEYRRAEILTRLHGEDNTRLEYSQLMTYLPRCPQGDANFGSTVVGGTYSISGDLVEIPTGKNLSYRLYNFGSTDPDAYDTVSIDFDEYFDPDTMTTEGSIVSETTNNPVQVLARNEVSKKLEYHELKIDYPPAVFGDSDVVDFGESETYSITMDRDNTPYNHYRLYHFGNTGTVNQHLCACANWDNYYSPVNNPEANKVYIKSENGLSTNNFLCRNNTDKKLEYNQIEIEFPKFTVGDSEVFSDTKTRSIVSEKISNNSDQHFYSLYGFSGSTKTETTQDLVSNQTTDLLDSELDFVVRKRNTNNTNELQYQRVKVKMPEIPPDKSAEIDALQDDVDDLKDNVESMQSTVLTIENDVAYLSGTVIVIEGQISGISGDYWQRGGGSESCYGSAIGNSEGTTVIDLTDKELVGDWSVDGDLQTDNLTANGEVYGSTLNGDNVYGTNGEFTTLRGSSKVVVENGYLQIGNTTLNETQLRQLLALLS